MRADHRVVAALALEPIVSLRVAAPGLCLELFTCLAGTGYQSCDSLGATRDPRERTAATTLPLRYRVADRLNGALKRGLGPLHGALRHGVAHADWGYRAVRQPGTVIKLGRRLVGPIPVIGKVARSGLREARRMKRRWQVSLGLLKSFHRNPESARLLATGWRHGGLRGLRQSVQMLVPAKDSAPANMQESIAWTCPSSRLLARMRRRRWPASAPKFTLITAVHNVREDWLREAIGSVIAQTYARWEMICINDHSTAPHIRPVLDELSARDSRVRRDPL